MNLTHDKHYIIVVEVLSISAKVANTESLVIKQVIVTNSDKDLDSKAEEDILIIVIGVNIDQLEDQANEFVLLALRINRFL